MNTINSLEGFVDDFILSLKPPQGFHCCRVGNYSTRNQRYLWIAQELHDRGIKDEHLSLAGMISELMFKIEHFERECQTIDRYINQWVVHEILDKISDVNIRRNGHFDYYYCPHCNEELRNIRKIMKLKDGYALKEHDNDNTLKEHIKNILENKSLNSIT